MVTGGVHPPQAGYFEEIQRLCREHDILFIADEVITGFGRTGKMFASTRYQLQPDIVTFAKGVTSGYAALGGILVAPSVRSDEHTSELQSLMRISYAVFCLKKNR